MNAVDIDVSKGKSMVAIMLPLQFFALIAINLCTFNNYIYSSCIFSLHYRHILVNHSQNSWHCNSNAL